MARLHCRVGDAEFLPIDAAVEHLQVKRVVREDRELCDKVADLIVRRFQRRQTQVLLMSGFEDVIRNVAGLGHVEITVVHGLSENHRHKAVFIGNLLRVTRLQWCHSGKKAALFIH